MINNAKQEPTLQVEIWFLQVSLADDKRILQGSFYLTCCKVQTPEPGTERETEKIVNSISFVFPQFIFKNCNHSHLLMYFSHYAFTWDKPIFPIPWIRSVPRRFAYLAPPLQWRLTLCDEEICCTGSRTCGKALSDDFSRCSPLTSPPGNPLPHWKVGSRQGKFPVDWSEEDIFHES